MNTTHSWLETSQSYVDRYFGFWTIEGACDWSELVLSLGLLDESQRLTPSYYEEGGGTAIFLQNAPAFPLGEWVRVTTYINFYDGIIYVWQNGAPVTEVTFVRETKTLCHWFWGVNATANFEDVVYYEDDNSVWKLNEPWTDFTIEPWFAGSVTTCPP